MKPEGCQSLSGAECTSFRPITKVKQRRAWNLEPVANDDSYMINPGIPAQPRWVRLM